MLLIILYMLFYCKWATIYVDFKYTEDLWITVQGSLGQFRDFKLITVEMNLLLYIT